MRARIAALPLLVATSFAANIPITSLGVTATEAAFRYCEAGTATIAVTANPAGMSSYTPNDVNSSLFTGSNLDTRIPAPLLLGNCKILVVGAQTSALASDGNYYSRALQATTPHVLTLTAGSDSGSTTFTTSNPALGNSSPMIAPYVSGPWGNYAWPSMSWTDQTKLYIDPRTGLLIKRITGPGQSPSFTQVETATYAYDIASAWTTASCILGTSCYASTASTGMANALFLSVAGIQFNGPGFYAENQYDDLQITMGKAYASGAGGQLSGCISVDHGQHCLGSAITASLPNGIGSAAAVSAPTSGSTCPTDFPCPLFADWGQLKITAEQQSNETGTVSVSGTTVTLVSVTGQPTFFPLSLIPGDHITISGSSPTCPANDCTIAGLVNQSTLTISQNLGALGTASFAMTNFGYMVWNSGAGTVFLQNATYTVAGSTGFSVGVDGGSNDCSSATVTVNYQADGMTALVPAQIGRTCQFLDVSNNPSMYLFIPQTGESRLIAYGSDTLGNQIGQGTFDPSSPNIVWYYGNSNHHAYKCTYNASTGHYAALSPSYVDPATSASYTCADETSMAGQDLLTQISNIVPGFNASYFNHLYGWGPLLGNYVGFAVQAGGEGGITYNCWFDVTQAAGSQVVACNNTWTTYPARWGGQHGFFTMRTINGWATVFVTPLLSPSATGTGQYNLSINSITGDSGTGLTSNIATDPTTQNCASLGVSDPRWIALGATGNTCIQMIIATEPQNTSPSSVDKAQFPSACNASYAQLQTIQPGDFFTDGGNISAEQFLVAGKTGSGCSPITLVIARGASAPCSGPTSHSNGWTPVMQPNGACTGNNMWSQESTPNIPYADPAGLDTGHSFIGLSDGTGTNLGQYTVYNQLVGFYSYAVRQGNLPSMVSSSPYGVNMTPLFAGSTGGIYGANAISYIQAHPGGQSNLATPPTIGYDGRPPGPPSGCTNDCLQWYHTLTLVGGQANTYQISCPEGSPSGACIDSADPKKLAWAAWAGRFSLTDISGPGSVASDASPYTFCYAYNANECVSGSSVGNRYVVVPNADTGGACYGAAPDRNAPCLVVVPSEAGQATEFNWNQFDPHAALWRSLGYLFNGAGATNNYWNVHGISDGTWAFADLFWKEGVRNDIVAIKLPTWPSTDTVTRSTFVNVPVSAGGPTGTTARVRFGYNTNLYCTTRLEQCSTAGVAPYTWVSETQTFTACSPSCDIQVPALSGQMLYYVVDRQLAGVTSSGEMKVVSVP